MNWEVDENGALEEVAQKEEEWRGGITLVGAP